MPGSHRWGHSTGPTLMAATPLGYSGQTCMPNTPETPSRTPSSTIILPPPPPSSVGRTTKLATVRSCHGGQIIGQSNNSRWGSLGCQAAESSAAEAVVLLMTHSEGFGWQMSSMHARRRMCGHATIATLQIAAANLLAER